MAELANETRSTVSVKAAFKFTPSQFAALDRFRCPLQLRYAMQVRDSGAVGATTVRPVNADCERGIEFERALFEALTLTNGPIPAAVLGDGLPHSCPKKNLSSQGECVAVTVITCATWDSFRNAIAEECRRDPLVAGPAVDLVVRGLHLSPAEAESAGLFQSGLVRLGESQPDVVRIHFDKRASPPLVVITVADIKSASHVKRYHKLQIALYHRVLEVLVKQSAPAFAGLCTIEMSPFGEVWLDGSRQTCASDCVPICCTPVTPSLLGAGGQRQSEEEHRLLLRIESFDVCCAVDQVLEFAKLVVPLATAPDIEGVPWVLKETCRGCERLEQCQETARQIGDQCFVEPANGVPEGSAGGFVVVADDPEESDAQRCSDILVGIPLIAPRKPSSGSAATRCWEPRSVPVFSRHCLTCFVGEHHAAGDPSRVCGAPTKQGTPCRISVPTAGARCHHHIHRCGVPTSGGPPCKNPVPQAGARCSLHTETAILCGEITTKGQPCKIPVPAVGERCQYHSQHRCGAPTQKGEPCKIGVSAAGERCKYHDDGSSEMTSKSTAALPNPSLLPEQRHDDPYSGVDAYVEVTRRVAGDVVCCALTSPTFASDFLFIGSVAHRNGTKSHEMETRSTEEAWAWLQSAARLQRNASSDSSDGPLLVVVFDSWQADCLANLAQLVHSRANSSVDPICSGQPLRIDFDTVITSPALATDVAEKDNFSQCVAAMCQLRLVSMVDNAAAHVFFSPEMFLPDHSLLTARRLLTALLPAERVSAALGAVQSQPDIFDLRSAPISLATAALPLLADVLRAVTDIAAQYNTIRTAPLPPVAPLWLSQGPRERARAGPARSSSEQPDLPLDGSRQLWCNEIAAASAECADVWMQRRRKGAAPLLVRLASRILHPDPALLKFDPTSKDKEVWWSASVLTPSEIKTQGKGVWDWFRTTTGTTAPDSNNANYLDSIQDTIDISTDFLNGGWLCALCVGQSLTPQSLTAAVKVLDAFPDWEYYDKMRYFKRECGAAAKLHCDVIALRRDDATRLSLDLKMVSGQHATFAAGEVYLCVPNAQRFLFPKLRPLQTMNVREDVLWELLFHPSCGDTGRAPPTRSWKLGPLPGAGSSEQSKLTRAQSQFMEAVEQQTLTILWGPPGTGKTTTLAWLIAKMRSRGASEAFLKRRVLVVANTNTALEQLFDKVKLLDATFAESAVIPLFQQAFRDSSHGKRTMANLGNEGEEQGCVVLFTTVWQLNKVPEGLRFDMLLIDEASQMLVSHALLASARLRSVEADSNISNIRLVIAGDVLQLPPIPPQEIAESKVLALRSDRVVFQSSVLESVLFVRAPSSGNSSPPTDARNYRRATLDDLVATPPRDLYNTVTLDTSYRSHPAIVQRVAALYSGRFTCAEEQRWLPTTGKEVVCVRLAATPVSLSVEAQRVCSIVMNEVQSWSGARPLRIGVVTPHRRQRRTILGALERSASASSRHGGIIANGRAIPEELVRTTPRVASASTDVVDVDTVERMQGKEYDVVVLALASVGLTPFVLNLQRLNVATSRAKRKLFTVTTEELIVADAAKIGEIQHRLGGARTGGSESGHPLGPLVAWEHLRRFFDDPE